MRLLLHMCCGPCSIYPVSVFKQEGIDFEGVYYNPNIHPIEEYERRMENVKILSQQRNFKVSYIDGFMQDKWEQFTGEDNERCTMCYTIRIDRVAEYAKANSFDAFTTSLLISPYQKHDLIKSLGERAAQEQGIDFYYRDFRPYFREGQSMAKEAGLYRQKYCGCIISKPSK